MTQRTQRIDELLRQEIGDIVAREVSDPRIGFATITKVETAPDLGHAKVWVSVIGQPAEREETVAALGRAMPFVRRQLGTRIRLRRIPELHLRLDETADRGTRILQLLTEIDEGKMPDADRPIEETLPTPIRRVPVDGDEPALAAEAAEAAESVARATKKRRSRDPRGAHGGGDARPHPSGRAGGRTGQKSDRPGARDGRRRPGGSR